jgi:hypothetical protein
MSTFPTFELRFAGAFFCLDGPARRRGETAYSQRKLCFTATDQGLLARHLQRLAEREDCFFVKFGARARAGMYLGRCFLLTDTAVGQVWSQYKTHPSLYCVVQDDDFVRRLRDQHAEWLDDDQLAQPKSSGHAPDA